MKLVHQEETKVHQPSDTCKAFEYDLHDKEINGAIVEINGRYPKKGRVVNKVCKEMGFVIKGSGKIVIDEKDIKLKEGDVVLFEPGEKYYWDGNLTVFIAVTPAWYPEQHEEID